MRLRNWIEKRLKENIILKYKIILHEHTHPKLFEVLWELISVQIFAYEEDKHWNKYFV